MYIIIDSRRQLLSLCPLAARILRGRERNVLVTPFGDRLQPISARRRVRGLVKLYARELSGLLWRGEQRLAEEMDTPFTTRYQIGGLTCSPMYHRCLPLPTCHVAREDRQRAQLHHTTAGTL